jgi:4-hydroxybenzoate polyprenyltransferase
VPSLAELVRVSRPTTWINTAVPFLFAGYEHRRRLDARLALGTLYFLGPYNLLVYGVNDAYDYESDLRNPRKASLEGANVPPDRRRATLGAVLLANAPPLIGLAATGGRRATVALAATAAAAVAYSAPPLRTKERPVLDSVTSALHFALPAACGYVLAGAEADELPARPLTAFVLWGMASHALGAIQDVEYDRAGGIASVGTALGERATALAVTGLYLGSGALLASLGPEGRVAAAGTLVYAALGAWVLVRPDEETARRAWRTFMGLNLVTGAVVTELLLARWGLQAPVPFLVVAGSASLLASGAALAARRLPPRPGRLGAAQAYLAGGGRDRLAEAADGNLSVAGGLGAARLLAGAAIPALAALALGLRRREALVPLAAAGGLALLRRRR